MIDLAVQTLSIHRDFWENDRSNDQIQSANSPNFPQLLPVASIQQTAKGYRAQVAVKGQRDSQTFATKREAQQWAAKRETELRANQSAVASTRHTLSEAFTRYAAEVSQNHKGWRWEQLRLKVFERSILPTKLPMGAITAEHIALWRDARSAQVAPGSVLREAVLLSAVFEVARREWRWVNSNPVKDIRKPSKPMHRERVISRREIKLMLRALDHHPGQPAKSVTQSVALCFLAALRTGMRAGELAHLTWDRYHGNYIRLETTKTGTPRDVPLSTKARMVFERARGFDRDLVFGVASQTLDTLFRRARSKAGLSGFTFHDSRHTAATWIGKSGRLNIMEFCKIFGWRDTRHALVYFNPSVSDLAEKLG